MLLIKGADYLIEGAASIARRAGIKPIVIGLTVVAFGTSAPELAVSVFATLSDKPDVAIGNVLGSNIANILLILGATALVRPIALKTQTVTREIPLAFAAPVILLIITRDRFLAGRTSDLIGRIDGLVLLAFFLVFLYYTYTVSAGEKDRDGITVRSTGKSVVFILMGLAGLVIGGQIVVDGAVAFARWFGLSERIIGLTVVALGTSLPELVTSLAAAAKKQVDLAVGNIVGSNIFNIFFVLGASSVISPLPFSAANAFDALIVMATTLFLFVAVLVGGKKILKRWQGGLAVGLYVTYVLGVTLAG